MSRRAPVLLPLEQLVGVEPHLLDAFFVYWLCRLCAHTATAVDRETALNDAAHHLASAHRAHGGLHRHHLRNRRRNR